MNIKQDTKTVFIDNNKTDVNYPEFLITKMQEAIKELDKDFPEWRTYPSYVSAKSDEDDFSYISIHYTRYMTKEEEEYTVKRMEVLKQGTINNMKQMIRQYPEEAKEFIKELLG